MANFAALIEFSNVLPVKRLREAPTNNGKLKISKYPCWQNADGDIFMSKI